MLSSPSRKDVHDFFWSPQPLFIAGSNTAFAALVSVGFGELASSSDRILVDCSGYGLVVMAVGQRQYGDTPRVTSLESMPWSAWVLQGLLALEIWPR